MLRQSYGIIRRIAPRGFILSDTLPAGAFIAHDAKPRFGSLNHGPMANLKAAGIPNVATPASKVCFRGKAEVGRG